MPASPAIQFHAVDFHWPDGGRVLEGVTATFSASTGLIGRIGCGKSTLLRLITGELQPTRGTVRVVGDVGVLPQDLTLAATTTVASLLGIEEKLASLRAIEAGSTHFEHYDRIGDDWDFEARALAALGASGLGGVSLDRQVGHLSGGEAVLIAVIGLTLARHSVTLLDEPTNNLDAVSKAALLELVARWPGVLLTVSHDLDLLNAVNSIAELAEGRLTLFGGPYDFYAEQRDQMRAAAEQVVAAARQKLRVEQRQRVEAETKLARSARRGRRDEANSRFVGAVADERRRRAEQTAGKVRGKLDDRVAHAEANLAAATTGLGRERQLSIVLPDPAVPAGRRLVELHDGKLSLVIAGPQRVALTGRNGVGKTRLIRTLFESDLRRDLRAVKLTTRVGYLPQRLDDLDDQAQVLAWVEDSSLGMAHGDVRARLAGFGLSADAVTRPVGSLSGGERLKVALARILLTDPPPELLVLDEPTNNLDLPSIEVLVTAVNAYRGGLLVVSHDRRFLNRLGIDTWVELAPDSGGSLRLRVVVP